MLTDAVLERIAGVKAALEPFLPILGGDTANPRIDEFRAGYNRQLARNQPPPSVTFGDVDMGGVPAIMAIPDAERAERTLLYLHGGGYFSGGSSGYRGIAGRYAELLGARVFVPDYRLAPEHRFPAALDDVVTSYRWLVDRVRDGSRIALAGDSAGGAMVVSAMVRARTAGVALPVGGVAISPWASLEMTGASYGSRDGLDPVNSRDVLVSMARTALDDGLPSDPEVSPVFADVRGLPPMMIQVGENEVMLSDAMRLATHLAEHRVHTTLEVWPRMFHAWHLFSDVLAEARDAIATSGHFLARVYGDAR